MKKLFFPILVLMLSACGANAQRNANDSAKDAIEEVAEPAPSAIPADARVAAPQFTLNDINGKPLSLSDLKGKWVVLDFWGSWCPWCIKGFPALKEAYKEYNGKIEVLGIDCRDSEEVWKEAVKKYELPWLQVYLPEGSDLLQKYEIQGFPTKFIIDPDGKVANVTIGEDPQFFNVLKSLVK